VVCFEVVTMNKNGKASVIN